MEITEHFRVHHQTNKTPPSVKLLHLAVVSILAATVGCAGETDEELVESSFAFERDSNILEKDFERRLRERVVYDEEKNGDLSNDGSAPTRVTLRRGANVVRNTFNNPGDPDYLTIVVPRGTRLTDIELRSWEADPFEDIGFFGVQRGEEFTFAFPNDNPEPASGLLGWSHLRSAQVDGFSVLDEMATSNQPPDAVGLDEVFRNEGNDALIEQWAPGAEGFADFSSPTEYQAELGPGTYTFWFRQGSGVDISVEIAFVVQKDRRCFLPRIWRGHDETCDGDLSNDQQEPTDIGALWRRRTPLSATFNNCSDREPDPDYLTFRVPGGRELVGIKLRKWTASPVWEDIGFAGLVTGNTFDFTFPNEAFPDAPATGLLGWSHLRSAQVDGQDVLAEMAVSNLDPKTAGLDAVFIEEGNGALVDTWAPGAQGFEGTLGAGTYSMWLRQGSCTNISADLEFVTGPSRRFPGRDEDNRNENKK